MIARRTLLIGVASAATLSRAGEAKISASRSVRQGFNLIQTTHAPLGSESAKTSLQALRRTGADTVALIPFFWQAKPNSTELVGGSDMSPEQLRLGIRAARAAGLKVMVKPHIWVPTGWAGLIGMEDDAGWSQWFGHYRRELEIVARVALEERAEWLCIGTEFLKTVHRPEWREVIASVRRLYQGPLVYMAHGADEVEAVPFWADLDFLGVTLYPPLGNDHDRLGWQRAMSAEYGRVEAVARKNGKQVWVGEIGIRSAQGAAAKPWESAEERAAEPVPQLQADVLATWLDVLDRESVAGILIWRWLSDPNAGGALDTDFTVQHKAAEAALRARWIKSDTRAQ